PPETVHMLVVGPLNDESVLIGISRPQSPVSTIRTRLIEDNRRGRAWLALQALNHLRLMLTR
ncbi:MAG: hypothetical protein ACOCW2_04525, partial [Chitinivibrionales bacterium]